MFCWTIWLPAARDALSAASRTVRLVLAGVAGTGMFGLVSRSAAPVIAALAATKALVPIKMSLVALRLAEWKVRGVAE